jgi:1-acyl-sn-glycerol-3-phosphate acyltransferase
MDLLSYPRGVIATLFCAVHTLLMSALIIVVASVIRNRKVVDWFIINAWCKPMLWVGGVEVEVRGADLVTKSHKGYLILFNHSSHMDIPVLCAHFPRTFRFGAKIELFKFPIFGKVM